MKKEPQFPDINEDIFEGIDDDKSMKPISKSQLKKMTLLDRLESLIESAKNSALNTDFFQLHADLIQSVADDLVLTPEQAVMLCPYVADPDSWSCVRKKKSRAEA